MRFRPMLAVLGDKEDLRKKGFIFEPKLDGYRILIEKNKQIKLFSRTGRDMTSDFPIDFRGKINAKTVVIDGEIVAYDKKGLPDFQLLQNRKNLRLRFTFIAFDILMKDNILLLSLPLIERKRILRDTILESWNLQIIPFTKNSKKLWSEIEKRNLEGVIAKRSGSQYMQARSQDWIKIKKTKTIDCLILGYTSKRRNISSLALGIFHEGKIIYIGKVGTGFSENALFDLRRKFLRLTAKTKPRVYPSINEKIFWIKPKLVAEVRYSELTKDKMLRAPVYLGLREDKSPEECRFTKV